MTSRGSHVRIDSLSHRYQSRSAWILEELSLTIEPGQRVALVGRSGCGKSTLLQLISGLSRPSKGEIHIDGLKVRTPSPKWNVMFQKPSLYPWMNAQQSVTLGMRLAGAHAEAKTRVPELLELVGMSAFANRNVQQLSGGQQQRIALARSLATKPELLMLDEPFGALDEVTRTHLRRDVTRLVAQFDMTQILVTHDIDEAVEMAERIIVMSSQPGRIVADLANDCEQGSQRVSELKVKIRRALAGSLNADAEQSNSLEPLAEASGHAFGVVAEDSAADAAAGPEHQRPTTPTNGTSESTDTEQSNNPTSIVLRR